MQKLSLQLDILDMLSIFEYEYLYLLVNIPNYYNPFLIYLIPIMLSDDKSENNLFICSASKLLLKITFSILLRL